MAEQKEKSSIKGMSVRREIDGKEGVIELIGVLEALKAHALLIRWVSFLNDNPEQVMGSTIYKPDDSWCFQYPKLSHSYDGSLLVDLDNNQKVQIRPSWFELSREESKKQNDQSFIISRVTIPLNNYMNATLSFVSE